MNESPISWALLAILAAMSIFIGAQAGWAGVLIFGVPVALGFLALAYFGWRKRSRR